MNLLKIISNTYEVEKKAYIKELEKNYDSSLPTIIIYNMGKVGSTSLFESLQILPQYNVYHVHHLNPDYLSNREEVLRKKYNKDYSSKNIFTTLLWKPQWIKEKLMDSDKEIVFINSIRESLSRNVSNFFQWMTMTEIGDQIRYSSRSERFPYDIILDKGETKSLVTLFSEKFPHDIHENWIQQELNPTLGIDFMNEAFDAERGVQEWSQDNFTLLTFTLEKLADNWPKISQKYLKKPVKLLKANQMSEKRFSAMYEAFKNELSAQNEFCTTMLNSDFMQHFYTPEMIEGFHQKWKL